MSKDTFWIHKILRNSDYGDMGEHPLSITDDVNLNLSIGSTDVFFTLLFKDASVMNIFQRFIFKL